jgi:hypothetical protein
MVSLLIVTVSNSCRTEKKYTGGPYYFSGWRDYKIPFEPIGEISLEKAKESTSYYEAYFDGNGNISIFKKYLNGELEWRDEYIYDKSKKIRCRILKKWDGSINKQYFDEKGKIIR